MSLKTAERNLCDRHRIDSSLHSFSKSQYIGNVTDQFLQNHISGSRFRIFDLTCGYPMFDNGKPMSGTLMIAAALDAAAAGKVDLEKSEIHLYDWDDNAIKRHSRFLREVDVIPGLRCEAKPLCMSHKLVTEDDRPTLVVMDPFTKSLDFGMVAQIASIPNVTLLVSMGYRGLARASKGVANIVTMLSRRPWWPTSCRMTKKRVIETVMLDLLYRNVKRVRWTGSIEEGCSSFHIITAGRKDTEVDWVPVWVNKAETLRKHNLLGRTICPSQYYMLGATDS